MLQGQAIQLVLEQGPLPPAVIPRDLDPSLAAPVGEEGNILTIGRLGGGGAVAHLAVGFAGRGGQSVSGGSA